MNFDSIFTYKFNLSSLLDLLKTPEILKLLLNILFDLM